MKASDFEGLYAIIPTPARGNASEFGAVKTVDLSETSRVVEALIADGVSGLVTTGTTGECATLSSEDFNEFAACVLETVKKRIPTFIGTTALGSHEAARRLDFVREKGADGTLLGLPMWQPVTTGMAVSYYAGASEYRPDLALMVYANARAFRYSFPIDFWKGVAAKAKTATSAKFSRTNDLKALVEATDRSINFMPIDMAVQDFHAISPETTRSCWATAAAMGPQPCIQLWTLFSPRTLPRSKSMRRQLHGRMSRLARYLAIRSYLRRSTSRWRSYGLRLPATASRDL